MVQRRTVNAIIEGSNPSLGTRGSSLISEQPSPKRLGESENLSFLANMKGLLYVVFINFFMVFCWHNYYYP